MDTWLALVSLIQLRPPWKHLLQICDYPLRPESAQKEGKLKVRSFGSNYGQTSSLKVFKGFWLKTPRKRVGLGYGTILTKEPFSVDDFTI